MKICPRCNKTYTDENLNFCLDDGSVLEQGGGGALPETVMLNQPRMTIPTQQVPSQQYPTPQGTQPAWNTAPQQYSMQPARKSSKTWVWVLVILGGLVLLCGGGGIALVLMVNNMDVSNANTGPSPNGNVKKSSPFPSNTKSTGTNSSTDPKTGDRTSVDKVDLDAWVKPTAFGKLEYTNGELFMAAKQKGYYYVVAAPAGKNQTEGANTSLTLRNVDNASSSLGYGLVFHSNPQPLQQGYAFLIDSKSKKYRVVHHSPQKEDAVKAWTSSDAIKSGADENTLEVRDLADKIELYINGTMVTSITNVYGYKGGVVGLYSGDGINIAFKNLELRK